MVFYGSILEISNRSGILVALHKNNPYYKWMTLFSVISILNIVFHTASFYVEHIEDFDLSTTVLGALMNMLMHSVKVYLILAKNDKLINLYYQVKKLRNDPKCSHYKDASKLEKKIEIITKAYLGFVGLLTLTITTNPLLVQLIEFVTTGSVIKYRWELPFPYANPFLDLKSSPAYEITYGPFAISVWPMAMFVVSPDLLFLATCIHVRGLFDHLKTKLQKLNQCPNDLRMLRHCVDYQNSIYEIVMNMKRVFGSIFFIQSMGSLVIVCTQIFVATKVSLSEFKRDFQHYANYFRMCPMERLCPTSALEWLPSQN